MRLQFKYQNWRGNDHEYVVIPDLNRLFHVQDGGLHINGYVVTRDGEPRPELGAYWFSPNRRRSFEVSKLREVTVTP